MKQGKRSRSGRATGHDEYRDPSPASLREMPEVDFSKGSWRPNRLAARIWAEGYTVPGGRHVKPWLGGVPKTVRFPPRIWGAVEKYAKAKGLSVPAALRMAIVEWIQRSAPPLPRREEPHRSPPPGRRRTPRAVKGR